MRELNTIKTELETALAAINAYEAKPTKAESGRIRKSLGEVKKQVTGVRAALVAADKAQWTLLKQTMFVVLDLQVQYLY